MNADVLNNRIEKPHLLCKKKGKRGQSPEEGGRRTFTIGKR